MIQSKYKWLYEAPKQDISSEIIKEFNLSSIVRKILESKSITQYDEINTLINGTNKKHDSWLMSDMRKAVDRINLAIDKHERILVYGDYDADGVTSTTILVQTLQNWALKSVGIFLIDLAKVMVQINMPFKMLTMKAYHLLLQLIMEYKVMKKLKWYKHWESM